jgi:hypothetical protein
MATDPDTVATQRLERRLQVERIEPAHQRQILGRGRGR